MKFEPVNEHNRLSSYPTSYIAIITATFAGLLWYIFPSLGAWPLVLGILPWFLGESVKKHQAMLLHFYGPLLLIFLLTAVMGIWLAYDRSAAWAKFWILIDAVLLFYALANIQRRYLWTVVGSLGVIGALISIYFLISHDWRAIPGGIAIIDKIGRGWMNIRPDFKLPIIHPNKVAGILVMLLPYVLASTLYERRQHQETKFYLMTICLFTIGVGLLMTASRGAIIALAAGLGIWLVWVASKQLSRAFSLPRYLLFAVMLISPIIILVLALLFLQNDSSSLVTNLSGSTTVYSRTSLFRDTLDLISAFPLTGAGLAAFPGLHSQYIQRIPFPFYYYGHNLYLDILLEQGPLGLLAFIGLWGGAIWHLWRASHQADAQKRKRIYGQSMLRWATFSSLLIIALHGLVDDALYGERGIPLLFLAVGMALAVSTGTSHQPLFPIRIHYLLAVVLLFVGIGLVTYRPLRAALYENLAAVQMAQIELANWPTGRWYDNSYVDSLAPSETLLESAVSLNPKNTSAQYRLGQIALLRGDYETAIEHLKIAFHYNDDHLGIQKALGYSYAWAGQLDKALPLFVNVPNSAREMAAYSELWKREDREDLAGFAVEMGEQLDAANNLIP